METTFTGEHLLPGQLGHFFTLLAFVASLVSAVAYFSAVQQKDTLKQNSWKKLARWAFGIQTVAVFAVFAILYYIISNHLFEYKYAWQHSSKALPVEYLLSCFWEGQEGSFLLWSVWHSVLGMILIFRAKQWEAPVMALISIAQVCLATMLVGMYFFSYRLGSSPFLLLRLVEENQAAPIFKQANYLEFIKDGNGLNPLLQNYWMVIHPPVLFLGFASVIVPFAYAIAGMWTRNYKEWTKPALPWALFSAMILGTGIMMGAAWAYESLTFGGYWAWDPVENASLVPWLTLIAGIHTLLAYRSSGHALKSTIFFFLISFTLILYSTFLTRSGILGETSVHSFTDLGMSGQLLVYMLVFVLPAFILFIIRLKEIPAVKKEESTNSREFWLFIGALVLLISAIQMTFTTSIPVWNKLFKLEMAPPLDPVFHYNKIQIWIAIVLGILTAVVQFLKYKDTPGKLVFKKLLWPTLIALAATVVIILAGNINYNVQGAGYLAAIYVMLFASVYAVVANTTYIFTGLKGKLKNAGASIAHIGFGLVLLGILISSSKKEVISIDKMQMLGGGFFGSESKENPRENLMLPKNFPVQMGDYHVTYAGDSTAAGDPKTYFVVRYEKKEKGTGEVKERFNLYPDAFVNTKGQSGLTPNPASRHYLTKDIFTYVTAVPIKEEELADTAKYSKHVVQPGDSIFFSSGFMVLESLQANPSSPNYQAEKKDLAIGAKLKVYTKNAEEYALQPIYYMRDSSYPGNVPDTLSPLSLYVQFNKVLPEEKKIELLVKESGTFKDYIVLKAFIFPFINVLWIGIIIMIAGFVMSIVQRARR
ncbi:cytochrome c biogenesis protein CcsA [Chitinophaga pendula]|uniref:cytochrome c biogenesis protein CcsA n=1 Tax=Chitinophaga TaxID=79328 RepID=UPI000BAE9BC0|nr:MULTISPECIES: cytochrome c biogenesis protein CcsA [Chitinophaga]ASZ13545.1 cytochrome c assembly protein [Chitinophaga sp. MD30]UCJ08821.1 cytochrome c biogenesis protein CcsA [Chitinophaga pendula]